MIPLTSLYDKYIDRPKLTGQKKPLENIFPPSLKWARPVILDPFNLPTLNFTL